VSLRRVTLIAAACAACQAPPAPAPFPTRPEPDQLEPEEQRVWDAATRAAVAIERSCGVVDAPELEAYATGILDRLFPDLAGAFRVRVLSQPSVNAVTLADGSIYLFTGIVARLENEAQFAAVLAHEGVHFARRHTYADRMGERRSAFDSAFRRSREQELEADRVGAEQLAAAGYDVSEAVRALEHLEQIEQLFELELRSSTATHPDGARRVAELADYATGFPVGGRVEREAYLEHTARVRRVAIEESLARFDHRLVLLVLETGDVDDAFPEHVDYYRGEAFRMRGEDGDADRAEAAYRRALERAPSFAPSYRALGQLHVKRADTESGARYLRRYLELAPEARDAGFVRAELRAAERAR
jgi:predicted Zn-dependent protease